MYLLFFVLFSSILVSSGLSLEDSTPQGFTANFRKPTNIPDGIFTFHVKAEQDGATKQTCVAGDFNGTHAGCTLSGLTSACVYNVTLGTCSNDGRCSDYQPMGFVWTLPAG